ncbi:MAG: RNA polymerase sigma factor [Puniceicoccaceae bacterium]
MSKVVQFSREDTLVATLIERMASSDVAALDTLYHLYHGTFLRLFSSILKDDFEAEEVLQDMFVKLYREAWRYDPKMGAPFSWVVTIGKRMAIDRLRRREKRPQLIGDQMEQDGELADNDMDHAENPVHQSAELDWIRESLRGLPDSQREAIELAYFQGFTQQEIADHLGKPLGTIKSELRRGMIQLRKDYLEGNHG